MARTEIWDVIFAVLLPVRHYAGPYAPTRDREGMA